MKEIIKPIILSLLFFVLAISTGSGQEEQFSREKWNSLKKGVDYSTLPSAKKYEKEKLENREGLEYSEKDGKWIRRNRKLFEEENSENEITESNSQDTGNYTQLLTIIGIILLVLLIAFVLYLIFANSSKSVSTKKINKSLINGFDSDELETKEKSELEVLLENALNQENYRLAIRIHFVYILKVLAEKGMIQMERKKTNMVYLRELKGHSTQTSFSNISRIYEYIWYGKIRLIASQYQSVSPLFHQLLTDIDE